MKRRIKAFLLAILMLFTTVAVLSGNATIVRANDLTIKLHYNRGDGFRFDLVGLIDTETINEIMEAVHAVRPDVVFYGEGWTMSTTMTKEGYTLTTQPNSLDVPGFAFFSDNIRDGLRGNVFNNEETGYVSGANDLELTIEDCFVGSSGRKMECLHQW